MDQKNSEFEDKSSELVEIAQRLEEMVNQSESLKEKCRKMEENSQVSGAESDKIRSDLENSLEKVKDENGEIKSTLEKVVKDLEESKKLQSELGEKLAAETAGREAAISSKERLERKLEEAKTSSSGNLGTCLNIQNLSCDKLE